jgi:predicted ATP-binding protein involved in virulence
MTNIISQEITNQLITIEGLKGVGNVELNLMPNQRVYIFIGSNGVGKTKLLEALFQGALLSSKTFIDNIPGSFQAINFYTVSKKINYVNSHNFDFTGSSNNIVNVFKNRAYHTPKEYLLKEYACIFLGEKKRSEVDDKSVTSLPALGDFSERRAKYFEHIINRMENDFHSLGMSEDVSLWFALRKVSEIFSKNDNRRFEIDNVLIALNEIDKRFDSKFIDMDGKFNIFLKIDNKETKLSNLSSGFTSVLKIIQSIISGYANFTNETNLTHVKGVVFIDEIESHLHLEWQVKIVPLLKDIFKNTTFYIATHSPLVLTQLQQGEAYKLVRGDDGVVRSELIKNPSKQLFDDVLDDAFNINLNHLKIKAIKNNIKNVPKKKLLDFLNEIEQEDKNNNIDAKDLIE